MPPGLPKVFVILAVGLLGAWVLVSLLLLAGPACSVVPLGLCPLPR
jgi:hypothetical protein